MDVGTLVLATDHWEHAGGLWPLFPLLWFVVIAGTIYLFARRGCGRRHHHRSSGESVLGERFAQGEIDEREYRERLEVLRGARDAKRRS
jgi:putative membrane protein